ncbi:MAG: hypothetical protein GC185_08010 [Alphaproteobacteria bacterium]|nr:hypothetical protein [Alphaproteobacteria bacterium]
MLKGYGERRISIRLGMLAEDETAGSFSRESLTTGQEIFLGYIRDLCDVLEHSPLGRRLLQNAVARDVSVGLDPLLEPNGCFFYPAQNHFDLGYQPHMLQKTEKGMSRYLVSFLAGLRRAWHLHNGCGPDVGLRPEDFIRQSRCADADIGAVTHLAAWELRGAGASFLWRYLLSGQDGDVAVVFERAILENPYHQFDGAALRAGFNQWFAEGERTAACDHVALEIMDMALMQYMAQCAPNAVEAVEAEPPEAEFPAPAVIGRRRLARRAAEKLGLLPNGLNYLSGCPFNSEWYGRQEDDINRMHLLHLQRDILQVIDNNTLITGLRR